MASIKVKLMHKGAKMVLENFSTQIADTFNTEVFGRMMLGMDLARLSLKMAISRPKDIGKTTGMQAIPVKLTLRKNFFLLVYKLFAKEVFSIPNSPKFLYVSTSKTLSYFNTFNLNGNV